jgi:hypothetical protein
MTKTFGELGLEPGEMDVIKACLHAWDVTPTGYYLCSPNQIASAERLIARGFIADASEEAGPAPLGWSRWLVVKIDEENIEAMSRA